MFLITNKPGYEWHSASKFISVSTQAFRTVVVHPGQTVCTELVAAWPSTTVLEDYDDDGIDVEYNQGSDEYGRVRHGKSIKLQQKQNRVVLFAGAIPYAAVRATYECKVR